MRCRQATDSDFPALADMRWRLKTDDAPIAAGAQYEAFVAAFVAWARTTDDYVHWVAEDEARTLGTMSVAVVRKPPAPGEPDGRWSYLTNSYVYPDARDAGIGQALLQQVVEWARAKKLELMVVWPSERAYAFYKRAGFATRRDPLVLDL
ncbi:MAG: GNAT family N-acetyltransferase [Phenylobacterium sp.]